MIHAVFNHINRKLRKKRCDVKKRFTSNRENCIPFKCLGEIHKVWTLSGVRTTSHRSLHRYIHTLATVKSGPEVPLNHYQVWLVTLEAPQSDPHFFLEVIMSVLKNIVLTSFKKYFLKYWKYWLATSHIH